MVMLMFISVTSALLLSRYSNAGFVFAWPALGDFVLPLCFILLAQIFRNRVCAVIAVLMAFVNVILRIVALIIRKETFMPLGLDSVMLLWEHTDHTGLRAVFGSYYYLWMIPLLIVICITIGFFCVRVWYASRNQRRIIPNSWITVFAVLFVISIVTSTVYVFMQFRIRQEENMSGRLVRPIPVVMADFAGAIADVVMKKSEDCGYFPENISEEAADFLYAANIESLKPQGAEIAPEAPVYDRVIIVAAESLDLDVIRAYNPQMPPGVTPVLDRLYRENIVFTNCFTAAQPTSWGLTALLMSRLDYRRELKNPGNHSLFSIGRELGYAGYYFSPVSGHFGDNRQTYLKLFGGSMEHFFFFEEWKKMFNTVSRSSWGLADYELFDMVEKVLTSPGTPEKFVAVISTMDTHPPYSWEGMENCTHDIKSEFLKSLHSFDHHLGKFIGKIMRNPKLYNERTLIIVTADHSATHGENFLKRDNFNPNRIPLIFISPDVKPFAGLNREKYCSSIDITPTLVRFIGGKIPRSFMGRDLRSRKNHAIARTTANLMFVNAADKPETLVFELGKKEYESPEVAAFNDYFNLYYSNKQE